MDKQGVGSFPTLSWNTRVSRVPATCSVIDASVGDEAP